MSKELNTKKLFKMSLRELYSVANQMAVRLQWLHSTGKEGTEKYNRLAGELYHVAAIVEEKEKLKENKKFKY